MLNLLLTKMGKLGKIVIKLIKLSKKLRQTILIVTTGQNGKNTENYAMFLKKTLKAMRNTVACSITSHIALRTVCSFRGL